MAYNNSRYYDSPASSTASPQFATNPTRTKSQKWTTAPKVDYGGDDWGEEDDIYDDNSGRSKQGYGGPPMPSIPSQYLQTRPGGGIERSMTMPLETQGQASASAPVLQRQGTMPLSGGQALGSGSGSYGSVPIVRKPSKADRERQALNKDEHPQQQPPGQETPRQSVEFREDYQAENLPAHHNVISKSSSVPTTPPRIRRPAEIYASAHNSPVDTRPRTSESNKSLRQPPAVINNEVPDVPSVHDDDNVETKSTKQDSFGSALPKSASLSSTLNSSAQIETSEPLPPPTHKVDSADELFTVTAPQASNLDSAAPTNIPSNQGGPADSASLAPESAHDVADGGLSRSSTANSKNHETMSFAKMVSHAFSRKPQDSEDTTPQSGIEPPEDTTGSGIDTSVSPILPRVSKELESIAQERAIEAPGVDSEDNVQEAGYPGSGSSSKLPSEAASPSPPSTSVFDKRTSLENPNRTSASHPSVALLKDEGQRLQWRSSSPTHGDRRSQSPVIVIPKEDNVNHFEAEKSVEWGIATPISIHKPKEISPIDTHMPVKNMESNAIEENQVNSMAKEAGTSPANPPNKSPSFAAFLGQKAPQSSAARSTSPALSFKDFMGQRSVSPQGPSSSTPPNNPQLSDSSATTPTIGATPRFKDFLLQKTSTTVPGQSSGSGLGIQGSETNRGASPTHLTEDSQVEKPRNEPPSLDTSGSSGSNNESEQLTKQIFSQLHYDSPTAPSPQSPVKQDIANNSKLGAPSALKEHTGEDEPIRPLSTSPRQVSHGIQPPASQVVMSSTTSTQNNRASVSPVTPQDGKRVSDQIRQLHLHQPVPNPITRSIPPGSRFVTQKSGGDDDYEPSIADYQASTTSDFVPSPVETLQPAFPDTNKDFPEVPIILELRDILALSDAQDRVRCADKARELFASDHEGFRYRLQLWTQYVHSMDDRHPELWGSAGRARKMHKPRINPLLGPESANNQYTQEDVTDGDKYDGWGSLDDNPRGSRPSTGLAEGQARLSTSQQPPLNSGIVPQPQQQQQLHPGSMQLGGPQSSQQQQQRQQQQQQQQQPLENQRLAEFGQPQGSQPPSQAAQFTHFQQEHERPQQQPSEGHTKLKDKVSAVKVGKNLKALFSKKKDKDTADHGGTRHQAAEHIPETSQSQVPSSGRFGGFRAVSDFPQSRKEQSTLAPVEHPSQQRSASYQGVGAGLNQPGQYQPGAAPIAGGAQPQQPTWHRQPQGPSPQVPQTSQTQHNLLHAGPLNNPQEPIKAPQESATSLSNVSATQSAPSAPGDDTPPPLRRKSNSKPLPPKRGISGVSPSPTPVQKPLPPVSEMGQQQQQQQIPQPATQYPPSSFTNPFSQQQQHPGGQAPHDNVQPHPPSTGYEPSFSNASIASYERPKKRHSFFGSLGGQSSQGDLHQSQQGQGQGEGDHVKSGKRSSSSFFGQLKSQLPGSKHQHTASETTGLGGSSGEKKKKVGGLAFLKDLGTMDAFGKTEASKRKEEPRPQGAQSQLQPSPGQPKPANVSDPYVAKIYDSYTGTYMTYDEIVARDKALEAGMSPPARPASRQVSSPAGVFAAAQQASYGQPQQYVAPRAEGHVTPGQQPPQLQQSAREATGISYQSQGTSSLVNQPPSSQYVKPSHNLGPAPLQQEQQQWNPQAPLQPGQIQRNPSWNINQGQHHAPSIASVTSSTTNKQPGQTHLNPIDDDSTPPPLKKFSPSPSPPPRRAAAAGGPPPIKASQQGLIRKISSPPPPSARFRAIPSSPPPIRQKFLPSSPHSQVGGFTVMDYPSSAVPQPARSPIRDTHSPSNTSVSGYASPVPQPGGITSVGRVTPTVSETAALDSPRSQDREASKSPSIAAKPQDRSITPAAAIESSSAGVTSIPSSKPGSPIPVTAIVTQETISSEKGKEKTADSEEGAKGENKTEGAESSKDDEGKQKLNENNVPVTNDSASQSGKDVEPKKVVQNFDFDEKIAVDPEGPVPEPPKDDSDDEKLVMSATSGPGSAWEFY